MNNNFIHNTKDKYIRDLSTDINPTTPAKNKITLFVLFLYIIIAVIFIPLLLVKGKYFDILEVYLPNVDLLANLVSFDGGFLIGNYFNQLYAPTPLTRVGFFSQVIINYIALLGITYIISRETKLTGSIAQGWSIGFVMLMMTYLVPSQLISITMNKVIKYIQNTFHLKRKNAYEIYASYIPALLVGIIMTISIIMGEKHIIRYLRSHLVDIANFIINIPKQFK